MNIDKELVSGSQLTLNANHLIVIQPIYPPSLFDNRFTRCPIYLERGNPWVLICLNSSCNTVSASQYQVRILKYVDMCDNCVASALSYNFWEWGCTAGV
jgi:hypothetical protein